MKKVTFYTKLDCHLCDQAYQMLLLIALDIPMEIEIIDITHSHNRVETAYKHRIPVIAAPEQKEELAWPFTSAELRAYLA